MRVYNQYVSLISYELLSVCVCVCVGGGVGGGCLANPLSVTKVISRQSQLWDGMGFSCSKVYQRVYSPLPY